MKSKKKFELFNDGIVFIYNAKKNKSSFNYGLINSELKNFNLLVFRRAKTECSGKRGEPGQDYFKVHIIRENYIPEGAVQKVIDVLEAPSADGIKFKLTGDPVTYDYSSKGSSDVVIEMATVTFTRPERRY